MKPLGQGCPPFTRLSPSFALLETPGIEPLAPQIFDTRWQVCNEIEPARLTGTSSANAP